VGSERYNFFTDCQSAQTATMILRDGAEQFIGETERSLQDAIMIIKRYIQHIQRYTFANIPGRFETSPKSSWEPLEKRLKVRLSILERIHGVTGDQT